MKSRGRLQAAASAKSLLKSPEAERGSRQIIPALGGESCRAAAGVQVGLLDHGADMGANARLFKPGSRYFGAGCR